jgi:hypothetical protein
MCEKICKRISKKISEEIGEKIREKICEGKRETAIYKVQSPRQTAENNVEHPKIRQKKMFLYIHILYKDRQTEITV